MGVMKSLEGVILHALSMGEYLQELLPRYHSELLPIVR